MQNVTESADPLVSRTQLEPLAARRVSWGAVMAGTVAMLAVSLILWSLALAIIATQAHPSTGSVRESAMALWISAMVATLIGAWVGGWLSGYLPGNPRTAIGVAHGFLAWGLALILSFGFELVILRGVAGTAANALADATATAVESGQVDPFGVPTDNTGRPEATAPPRGNPAPRPSSQPDVTNAGRLAIDYLAGAGWSWFGTWFVAGVLAMAGAAGGSRRLRETPPRPGGHIEPERDNRLRPLTPAPTS